MRGGVQAGQAGRRPVTHRSIAAAVAKGRCVAAHRGLVLGRCARQSHSGWKIHPKALVPGHKNTAEDQSLHPPEPWAPVASKNALLR
jgi:hypothetical protein